MWGDVAEIWCEVRCVPIATVQVRFNGWVRDRVRGRIRFGFGGANPDPNPYPNPNPNPHLTLTRCASTAG